MPRRASGFATEPTKLDLLRAGLSCQRDPGEELHRDCGRAKLLRRSTFFSRALRAARAAHDE